MECIATTSDDAAAITRMIRLLLSRRGAGKTICPSEVARALVPHDPARTDAWRTAMPAVRAVVTRMAARGEIVVMQRGRVVDARDARGAIRIGVGVRVLAR